MADSPHVINVTAETFQSVVLESSHQRPVLVDFWADWCAPCRQLMPMLAKLASDYGGQFLLAKVDTEAEQALAMQFGIRSLPTVQLFKDGRAIDQFMGALPEAQVREFLERHLPNEGDEVIATARALMARQEFDAAEAKLAEAEQLGADAQKLFVPRAELLAARGDPDALEAALEHTPIELVDSPEVKALHAHLLFDRALAGAPDLATLEEQVAADDDNSQAKYQLAARQFLLGNHEAAFDHLLTLMQKDRNYGDDAARKAILMGFELLGLDHPLVTKTRGRLSRLLY
ncbi:MULTISPECIES: thioredoxin [Thiorhodovibrio]|uniref:thioredoxin n=1 Tax=Thiorhodovibrio TaxID=61593 RepID=UPI001912928C|nr:MULTISPECIES: thioredoxin [Thiorhodovibrio]MBK5968054.1 thioredoxin [Thiorhodovibrio winogradskyi]WPL11871.1 Thioredoxin-M [Thiorhodovibrio litoralis]